MASSWHCSLGMYLQVSLSSMSHKGWMDFFSHWSQISLGCSLQSLVKLYFLAFLGRVFISNSQIFLGSKWQFCFSTGKGKMLENFSQYLWTSVLHTSTWIFLGIL